MTTREGIATTSRPCNKNQEAKDGTATHDVHNDFARGRRLDKDTCTTAPSLPNLLGIPEDSLSIILTYLDERSLGRCEMTSTRLRRVLLGKNGSIWDDILERQNQGRLSWNHPTACGSNHSSGSSSSSRAMAIRYYQVMKLVRRLDASYETHFGSSRMSHFEHACTGRRYHKCAGSSAGCSFPSRLQNDWTKNPRDFEYFVRLSVSDDGLPPVSGDEEDFALLHQGFFRHSSMGVGKCMGKPPRVRLDMNLDDGGGALDAVNEGLFRADELRGSLAMMVLAVRKKDFAVGLLYTSNQIQHVYHNEHGESKAIMKGILLVTHLKDSERSGSGSSSSSSSSSRPRPPHLARGYISYEPGRESPWQAGITCTIDRR